VVGEMTDDAWTQLEGLVERLMNHQGAFGYWYEAQRKSENPFLGGYAGRGPLMQEAMSFVSEHGLLLERFDWPNWWANEGKRLVEDDDFGTVEELSLERTLGLITAITGGDRFTEGALLGYFDNRVMPRLLAHLVAFRRNSVWVRLRRRLGRPA
jgi:hypothetical protein